MALSFRRSGPSKFERAADGSMTLIEHLIELRTRLFYASLAVVVGLIVGYLVSEPVFELLKAPYCRLPGMTINGVCQNFILLSPVDGLIITLKIALWVGLIVSGPVWLYQLWAFIAPGLHRHERKWAYVFVTIATPLFAGGAVLAYVILSKSLEFLLNAGVTGVGPLEVTAYISFVTSMLLLFGVGFEFPLVLLMLNFTGVVTAKRLLSWWRVMVFLCTAFAAVATPDPGPFGMILLAAAMTTLYFIAVGVAFINDKRKGRGKELYAGLDDDAASPLDTADRDPVTAPDRAEVAAPVAAPLPLERRYDEFT